MGLNKNNIFLLGAPNVGKSTIFNKLTWKVSKTANYDNITFENNTANLRNNKEIKITDTPGIYSLDSIYIENDFLKYAIKNQVYTCSIISTKSIKRDLYMTIDLAESGILSNIVINNINDKPINVSSIFKLERKFKVKVFNVIANTGSGLKILSNYFETNNLCKSELKIKYSNKIEKFLIDSEKLIPNIEISKRYYLIQFLLGNKTIINNTIDFGINKKIIKSIKKHKITEKDIDNIREIRDRIINEIFKLVEVDQEKKKNNKIFLNSYFMLFLFITSIILIYFLTFSQWTGTYISDQMSNGFDALKEIIATSMNKSGIDNWWIEFVNSGLLDGIFTTLCFIPWIIILTGLTTLMEQSGFLSKVSICIDRMLDRFGVSGRTVVNLFMGTGCNIPAIMMCKNAINRREKVITSMIIPLVSCSARVVVFGWIVEAFNLESYNFLIIFSLTVISFIIALSTGMIFSNTLFRKNKTIFISEIIEWRKPDFSTLIKTIIIEVYNFVKKIILVILIINLIVWVLSNVSINGLIYDGDTSNSILRYICLPFEYALYPTGIFLNNDESWKLSMSLISSFPAKEIAASNLELLFGGSHEFGTYLMNSNPYTWVATLCSYLSFFMFYLPCVATAITIWKELGWKYLVINIVSIFIGTYVLSCIIYNVIGSLSLFANGITNISVISLFIVVITLLITISVIKITRNLLQNRGYIENIKINKIFKYLNISFIVIIAITLITNNIIILNI